MLLFSHVACTADEAFPLAGPSYVHPPLLYPTTVTGCVVLPKIVSQMLRPEPLRTKFCHLDLKAPHMTVDFGAVNALGVINFRLASVNTL